MDSSTPPANTLVVVLAGGSNSRFQPLRDKTLLSMLGRPLLAHHLDALAAAGFRDVVVVANARTEDRIRELLAPYAAGGLAECVVQERAAGMGDAVQTVARRLGGAAQRPLLITQAHDVVEPALFGHVAEQVMAAPAGIDGFITGRQVSEYQPMGYLSVAKGGRLRGIVEKPGAGNEPSDLINFVLHWHRNAAALFAALREQYAGEAATDDHYERALAALFGAKRYELLRYDGDWFPIKYPWQVLDVMQFYLRGTGAGGQVTPDVRLFPGAKIVGPAYVGPGCVIGNNSLVRESMIGAGTEIGYGCEIARSWVGSGVHLHHTYLGDSVVDDGGNFGFGTVTGNFPFYPAPVRSTVGGERLRTGREKFGAIIGARVRTGIGALLYPGVKIGYGAYIGPGVVVTADVEPRRLIVVKQELDVRENPFVPPEEA
ncbi:MAG TPA: sugar phosphate nucleotidyltransferase [Dehalococcoidia bacterium]|nr:sugar phosphate nucleotidyltransferase [Dehalococcoidia bacterium]